MICRSERLTFKHFILDMISRILGYFEVFNQSHQDREYEVELLIHFGPKYILTNIND